MNLNGGVPNQTNESNLFEFHLSAYPGTQPDQGGDNYHYPSIFQQTSQPVYSTFYNQPQTHMQFSHEPANDFSPESKRSNGQVSQRKRFKTVTASAENSGRSDNESSEANGELEDDDDDDDDDEETGSESDSNNPDHGKKRGKYKIYTEPEKAKILDFMMKHGMQKTLEIFSTSTHKITKRKLKSWIDSQNKIKGVKGRKTNDPNRDQTLYEWCLLFQRECGRAPTRKEATKKALELSGDPSFQASKGWLDKFSRKFKYEFTPLKIIPPKKKKGDTFDDSDSGPASAVSNSNSSDYESISPVSHNKHRLSGMNSLGGMNGFSQLTQMNGISGINGLGGLNGLNLKPWSLEGQMNADMQTEAEGTVNNNGAKMNSFLNFGAKTNLEGLNFDKNHTAANPNALEQTYYQQTAANHNMGYNYGYPLGLQQNFNMGGEDNYHMNYPAINGQLNPDINNFLNAGLKYDPNRFINNQHIKFEQPY